MATNHHSGSAGSPSRMAPLSSVGTPIRVLLSLTIIAAMLAVVMNVVNAQENGQSTPPAGTPEATPSAAMPRIELELEERNESDLGGTVTLYAFGDSTIVEFDVTGAGGDHPAYIATGTCEQPGDEPLHELNPVDNRGTSTTVIDTSLEDLLADDHAVSIRMSEASIDTEIACAMIEGEPGLESAATPAASPAATPSSTPLADGVGGNEESSSDEGVDGTGGATTEATETAATTPDATAETTDADGTGGATNTNAPTMTVKLQDWSNTGVTGTAVLTDMGGSTLVDVTITGPGVVGGHELHIHNATCATPGSATYTLNPIDANGRSTTTINLSLDTLSQNAYFINVHPDEANWDAWMVCANITGTTATLDSPVPTAAPVTTTGDGTGGGNVTTVTTNAQAAQFPERVGVGEGLPWPNDTRTTVIWSLATSVIILAAAGVMLRLSARANQHRGI